MGNYVVPRFQRENRNCYQHIVHIVVSFIGTYDVKRVVECLQLQHTVIVRVPLFQAYFAGMQFLYSFHGD